MPTCAAPTGSSVRSSIMLAARCWRRPRPRSRPSARCAVRERTRANSAATKNAVDRDEHKTAEEQQGDHGSRGGVRPLLREGSSSSVIDWAAEAQQSTPGVTRRVDAAPPACGRSAVMPPSECVVSVRRTLFHPWTRMSGWWLASSARSATRFTNAIAALEVREARSRARSPRPPPPLAALSRPRPRRRSAVAYRPSVSSPPRGAAMRIVCLVPSATGDPASPWASAREVVARHPRVRLPRQAARATEGHARRACCRLTAGQIDAAVRAH